MHSRTALTLMPEMADAHDNLANALTLEGRFDEAIGEFQLALAGRPNWTEARKNLKLAIERRDAILQDLAATRELLRASARYGASDVDGDGVGRQPERLDPQQQRGH